MIHASISLRLFTVALAAVAAPAVAQVTQVTVEVDGLACPFCAYGLEKKMVEVSGVETVEVDLAAGTALVTAAPGESVAVSEVPETVRQAGFTAGAIQVTAVGRVTDAVDGGWGFVPAGDDEEFLLVDLSEELATQIADLAAAAVLVRVTGEVHLHADAPTGIQPASVEAVE